MIEAQNLSPVRVSEVSTQVIDVPDLAIEWLLKEDHRGFVEPVAGDGRVGAIGRDDEDCVGAQFLVFSEIAWLSLIQVRLPWSPVRFSWCIPVGALLPPRV